jgi:hypothetical protein
LRGLLDGKGGGQAGFHKRQYKKPGACVKEKVTAGLEQNLGRYREKKEKRAANPASQDVFTDFL